MNRWQMYNEFYGFSEKPFELTPDPRFLFFTPSFRKALDSVIDGIRERRGFISVIGEAGTGKTILMHSLLNSLDEKVKTVFIFHTTLSFKDLLGTILRELDLRAMEKSKAGLLDQLIQYSTQIATKNETLVIIVDEAHKLNAEVMEELKIFSNLGSGTVQIVLVGQPELEDKLNSGGLRQLKQMIKVRCQISALSEEETKDYIDHRLRLVGRSSSEIFTPEAISMICNYAHGIPRIINTLCDNALRTAYISSEKMIDENIIRGVIKNIEGPSLEKAIASSSTPITGFHRFPFRLEFLLKKAPLILLFLFCIGGLFLLIHGYLRQKPVKIWNIKSIISSDADTEPISTSTLSQMTTPPSSIDTRGGEHKLKEIVSVKEGQTISQLTQKYYGTVNETFVDHILDLNPNITNVHLIMVDQKIKIPKITEELVIIQSPDHTYKIHVGTFQNPGFVRLYRNEPALKGKIIEIVPRKVSPHETWYRVVVGPFGHKDECLKTVDQLREKRLLPVFGGILKTE